MASPHLQKITAKAKQIRKSKPTMKWTDAIKQASLQLGYKKTKTAVTKAAGRKPKLKVYAKPNKAGKLKVYARPVVSRAKKPVVRKAKGGRAPSDASMMPKGVGAALTKKQSQWIYDYMTGSKATGIYDFRAKVFRGEPIILVEYRGNPVDKLAIDDYDDAKLIAKELNKTAKVKLNGLPAKTKSGKPAKRLTKQQKIENADVDAYKWFVVDSNNKIDSGWEYKSDAVDQQKEMNGYLGLKYRVVALRTLKTLNIKDPRGEWKWVIGSAAKLSVYAKPNKKGKLKVYARPKKVVGNVYDVAPERIFSVGSMAKKSSCCGVIKKAKTMGDIKSTMSYLVPEIKVTILGRGMYLKGVTSGREAAKIVYEYLTKKTNLIMTQEVFGMLLLNNQNKVIGIYRHSTGGQNATIIDMPLMCSLVAKLAPMNAIVWHNHPSGALQFSEADKKISNQLKDAFALMDCKVIDSIVVVAGGDYISMAEQGLFF